jgi:type IV pilus assembly protein PilB
MLAQQFLNFHKSKIKNRRCEEWLVFYRCDGDMKIFGFLKDDKPTLGPPNQALESQRTRRSERSGKMGTDAPVAKKADSDDRADFIGIARGISSGEVEDLESLRAASTSAKREDDLPSGNAINVIPESFTGDASLSGNFQAHEDLGSPGAAAASAKREDRGESTVIESVSAKTQEIVLDEDDELKELLQKARRLDRVSSRMSSAEIMLRKGLISREQLEEIIEKRGNTKGYLHQIIADMGLVPKKQILEVAADSWGVKHVDLEEAEDIDPEVIRMIPESKARRNLSVPVYKTETRLSVAMANPMDIFAADDIRISLRSTGLNFEIEPLLAFPKDIERKLEGAYGATADAMVQELIEGLQEDDIFLEVLEEKEESDEELVEAARQGPIVNLVRAILLEAVRQSASDIHIEPYEKKSVLRYRVDGKLREVPTIPLPRSRHAAIVSRIKIMAGCNIAERRLPQDGRIRFQAGGRDFDLRVSVVPTPSFGEAVCMRLTDRSEATLSLSQLGFLPESLKLFQHAIEQPYGLILVTGPTGSGKSTTLYSALNSINTPDVKILTAENPVERDLNGAVQVQTKSEIDLNFADILRAFLRHDPDIIMVGEIRDEETAKISIEAALTGHRVFATLHTNDAASAIIRLNEMGINEFLLASSVQLSMAQRLVQKICEKCKRPVPPTSTVLRRMEAAGVNTENLQIYQGAGCNACGGTGLKGRTGIHELLYIDDDVRQLILKGSASHEIRGAARKNGMRSLQEDGLTKVAQGITTFEEIMRATMDI